MDVYARLLAYFGEPKWQGPESPLDELVSTILSQNTNDRNRDLAFHALRERFPTWEAVRDAPEKAVVEAVRIAGLANQKGPRIQGFLRELTAERGSLDLEFLRNLPPEEARGWLKHFNGIGPKTAAIVMLFKLGIPAFPVDTHIYRVTGRIGLRPAKMSVEQTHVYMEELLPPETYAAAHINLIRLGRQICHARNPECPACPVLEICIYGQARLDTPGRAAR